MEVFIISCAVSLSTSVVPRAASTSFSEKFSKSISEGKRSINSLENVMTSSVGSLSRVWSKRATLIAASSLLGKRS